MLDPDGRVPHVVADVSAREATAHSEAILTEEKARAAAFGRGGSILAIVGLIVEAVRDNPPRDQIPLMASTAILGLAAGGVWWRSRNPRHYSRRLFRVFGVASAISALVLVHTLGVFSPIVVIIVLGLAYFVHGRDTRAIFPISITVIVAYAALALLVTAGVLPDRGVWKNPKTPQHLSMTVIVTAVMITQLVLARSNQRAIQDALARSQEAMRVVRTREAELDEVRENLDVALRAGNGGRLTGALLGGYRMGDVVGRGAMGEVYVAQPEIADPRKPPLVAIKVLRAHDDELVLKRFVREAEIARRVRGPNLVNVFETGQSADGAVYIVMELLAGQDLGAILRERTALSLEEVVTLVDETARGLTALHEAGVVHRDLKPQNLFLAHGEPPTWKILDYGVSKMIGAGTMTENNLVGTPGYMSPEQAQGGEIDVRSDVFSLGAVAYRALTGRRPFSGQDLPQILFQVVHGKPIQPRELVPWLPKEVETTLAIALAKRPADRFASAAELARALRAAALRGIEPVPHVPAAMRAARTAERNRRA